MMRKNRETSSIDKPMASSAKCPHYWVIDSPSGPTSRGMCKLCGQTKEFRNSTDDFPWEQDSWLPEQWGELASTGTRSNPNQ